MKSNNAKPFLTGLLLPIAMLFMVQCGDDPTAPPRRPEPPQSTSKVFDRHGGILVFGDRAWVIIPAGALADTLTVTIVAIDDPPLLQANRTLSGSGYRFEPHGHVFRTPVTVGIVYETTTADPSMMRFDDETGPFWQALPQATCSEGQATVETAGFSIFGVTGFTALETVHVSTVSRGIGASGTRDDPLPTISAGVQASLAAGTPFPPVNVAMGAYADNVTLASGMSLRGGLDPSTWEPLAVGLTSVDLASSPVFGADITAPTTVSGFDFRAPDATEPSGNSVALHLVDCGAELSFKRCRFKAGRGADGLEGEQGSSGADGANGGNAAVNNGGGGGAGGHMGGGGGWWYDTRMAAGGNGHGPHGGRGGLPDLTYGEDGGNGGRGAHGTNGAGGTCDGLDTAEGWQPFIGLPGAQGGHGSGGGGGGPGYYSGSYQPFHAGGGGGGGGGGHGGLGGGGGQGGGASFAAYVYESSPVFIDCEFIAGRAGDGGRGGTSTDGGEGGNGGAFGTMGWTHGGFGGDGGDGGTGGGGQGGPGGPSFCLYLAGAASAATITENNTFIVGSAGIGGEGGFHEGNGTQAAAGVDGRAGDIGP